MGYSGAGTNVSIGGADIRIYTSGTKLAFVSTANIQLSNYTSGDGLFQGFANLESINFNGIVNTSTLTNASNMFKNCPKLKAIDMSTLDLSNLTTATDIFYGTTLTAIKTPKAIKSETTISLNTTLDDANENSYTSISTSDVNKTLKKEFESGLLVKQWWNILHINC